MKFVFTSTKLICLIFFASFNAIYAFDENEYKLKEECEQLILHYISYENAYYANPSNVFVRDVLLALISKIEDKRKNPLTTKYIESRVNFEKLAQFKRELLINKYKTKVILTSSCALTLGMLFKYKENISNYISNNSKTILNATLRDIIPTLIFGGLIYKGVSKVGRYFTDGILSTTERLRNEQKNNGLQDNNAMHDEKNSKAKLYKPFEIQEKFSSVAGIVEAKEELQDVVDFLKRPSKYTSIGAKVPKGILLVGEPGNGKTLLARAVAGEANCHFFNVNGSEFVEQWVGLGAARVRDLFKQARKVAPCIVFIDEIDAIGARRSGSGDGGEREYSQTLNQLLTEMDGFEKAKAPVIILAATNKAEILDKALTRPGRFDRKVYIPYPDLYSREEVLKVHLEKVKCEPNLNLKNIAFGTPEFSGADLANLVNEAALNAIKNNRAKVSMADFDEARDKMILGKELKTIQLTDTELRITAYHEAGHALVLLLHPQHPSAIFKVTIVPRGQALGVTHFFPEHEIHKYSKEDLIIQIKICLGGRIAEDLVFNNKYSGAASDLVNATSVAKNMVTKFGMSDLIGAVNCEISKQSKKVDDEIQALIKKCYDEAYELIVKNRDKLDKLANALLDKKTLFASEIYKLLDIKPRSDFQI